VKGVLLLYNRQEGIARDEGRRANGGGVGMKKGEWRMENDAVVRRFSILLFIKEGTPFILIAKDL